MKLSLRKVGKTPLDFEVKSKEITFKGYLEYHAGKLILLKAHLSGIIDTECNICAKEIKLPVDEEIEFFISDGIYEDQNDIELDVVESLDSQVDLDELLASEIELLKSDYYRCEECQES
ncbi:hypothetical protein KJ877_06170 [bacterium]|nr:hypothetical protein [bacterium]MBU1989771.1 hypothetical protein [bacterium]